MVVTTNNMNMLLTMIVFLVICITIDQIDNRNKTAVTKKNVAIVQTNDIREKVCLKHNNMLLQYLILTYYSCNNDCCLQIVFLTCVVVSEKRKDNPCNHTESVTFIRQENRSYFSMAYINANQG